ncbi:hypothetical protein [Streptomyces sp. NPDC005141]
MTTMLLPQLVRSWLNRKLRAAGSRWVVGSAGRPVGDSASADPLGGEPGPFSLFGPKAKEFCNTGDPVCGNGRNSAAHLT